MPISATCRRNDLARGFTLLELVVVLALVTLLGAVVMPGLLKMQAAWQRRTDNQGIDDQLRSLSYRARLNATEVMIGPVGVEPPALLVLPSGWKLTARIPIIYRANGVCLGGDAVLERDGIAEHVSLKAPLCAPERS